MGVWSSVYKSLGPYWNSQQFVVLILIMGFLMLGIEIYVTLRRICVGKFQVKSFGSFSPLVLLGLQLGRGFSPVIALRWQQGI